MTLSFLCWKQCPIALLKIISPHEISLAVYFPIEYRFSLYNRLFTCATPFVGISKVRSWNALNGGVMSDP